MTDLAVQSPGPEIVWSRSYASQATEDLTTTLGFGWQHPYSARLILPSAVGDDAIVLSARGNQLRFTDEQGTGTYTADPGVYSTLVHANGVYTQTLLDQTQLVFSDTTGRLTGMVDSLGRKITLTYSGSPAQLTQIADANDTSRKLTLTYTSGRITQVSDGSRNVNYTYSGAGDLATVQDVRSQTTQYAYTNHLLNQTKNPLNQVVESMGYVGVGNASQVITQTIQDGRKFDFSYGTFTTVVTNTGVDGRRTVQRYNYKGDNSLTGIVDATDADPAKQPSLLSSGFDGSFSPSKITDGNGNKTIGTYTTNGLPLQQTNALTQTTKFQYASNRPTIITDSLGIATQYLYDTVGNLLKLTAGITTTTTIRATTIYTYEYLITNPPWGSLPPLAVPKDSRLLEQRSPDGVVTHYDYDATKAHQVVKMTVGYNTALKQETTYLYDSFGRVTSVTSAANNGTIARKDTTTYNPDNTVAQTIQNYKNGVFDSHFPDEDVITTYGYDVLGRQIWVKDALGHYDVTYYNNKGQVSSTIRNLTGFSGGTTLPANPPGYSAALPDANIATKYGYDSLGRTVLVSETGTLTGAVTLNAQQLPQFSDVITRVTRTEYDTLSRPVTVTLNYRPGLPQTADSNIPLYTRYDGAGNVITQTDALGRWTVMVYDKLNRPIKTIANYQDGLPLTGARDADIVTTTEYDSAGRVKKQVDNWVDSTFSATEPITDRATLYQYDTLGRTTTITNNATMDFSGTALNRVTITVYDSITGRVPGQRDSLGRWGNQQYDLLGRTIKSIQNCTNSSGTPVNPAQTACATFNSSFPDRNVPSQSAYDTLNRTTIVTDALNIETRTSYDGLGRVLKTIRNYKNGVFLDTLPDEDVATSYRYDALGRTLAITETVAQGTTVATQYVVNALGQVTSTTDQVGRVTLSGYDGAGTLRWTKRADGQVTVYNVDGLGRTVATIVNYVNGQRDASDKTDQDLISRTVYDAAGRRLQQIQRSDPADVITVFAYNNQDLLIGVTENAASGTCPKTPCNVVTLYQYDRAGNRTAITDPRGIADPQGKTRTFDYDAANQQIKATEPVSATFTRVTQWTYDAGGRMTGTTDPRGANNDLTITYDGLDRPKTTSATNLGTITQNYDAGGRRTSLVDTTTGTTTFTPDGLGRIKQVNAPNTGIINYTYNGRDRIKVVYPSPNNTTFNYTYLNDGRLQQVTQGSGLTPVARYNYDTVGRVVQAVTNTNAALNSQLVTNYRYDGADRLRALRTSEAGTTVSGYQYDTDRLGLRTTITETLPLSPTLSATRIKTMTFEGASLTDAATGADSVQQTPTSVLLDSSTPLIGAYSAQIPNTADSMLREDFTAADEVFASFYLRVNALPPSNIRIAMFANSGTTVGNIVLTTLGKLRLRNGSNTIGLDTAALTPGQIYRVGLHQKKGTGANAVLEAYLATEQALFTAPFASATNQTFTTAATRFQIGATAPTAAAITVDDIAIDTAALAQPSVNGLRANASPAASSTAATTTAIDPLAAQATGSEGAGRMAAFSRLPITFVPNAGQTDPSVRMQARGLHGNLFYGNGALTLALRPPTRDKTPVKPADPLRQQPKNIPLAVLQQRWVGANPTAEVTGTLKLPGRANFLIGNDPNKWRTNLPTFADMLIRQLYAGIDQYYSGVDGQLKTTYVVAPGADPSRIRWHYVGADSVAVDASGNLQVHLPAPASTLTDTEVLSSTLTELAPVATQTINEREVSVPVRFVVGPDGSVGFALGAYDATLPLTIDPTLYYSTYLGGSGNDWASGIALDSVGSAYITGSTTSADFPPPNPRPGGLVGGSDAFVAKLNPSGSALLYSTYLGGSADDSGSGIAVDAAGNAYVAGYTDSNNFPTQNPFQASHGGGLRDAFVTKLNASGSALTYSTYLGGSGFEIANGIAVDSSGNAYLTGHTDSTNFPVQAALDPSLNGPGSDVFVTKLNTTGTGLVYGTYLGGNSSDTGEGIVVDSSGNAYITGNTASTNFPTTSGAYDTSCGSDGTCNGGGSDAFVTKLNASGSALSYSTYFGGSGLDWGYDIAVDSSGNAYVTGLTTSTNFPTTSGAYDSSCGSDGTCNGGNSDAFVTKLNASGSALSYSTYLGGSGSDAGSGIGLNGAGSAIVVGYTNSIDFPTASALYSTYGGGSPSGVGDAFVTRLNVTGTALTYSTYLGGSGDDWGTELAVEPGGDVYVAGVTNSINFPVAIGVQQSYNGGSQDGFVAKLNSGGRVNTYTYDGLQRLIGAVENPGTSYAYTYDLAGNRTSVQINGGTPATTTYNFANEITNAGYTYDNAGNLTADGTTTYTYDALSRMTQRGTTTYTYNGDGVLVSQAAAGVTTRYTQDLASPLTQILQTKVGSATATDYVYGLGRLASLNGSTTTWYASDALGSVRRTFNTSATPLGIVNYDPWGTPESGSVPTFGFTGELQDTATGLVNLRARWYSTTQGKFTSVDPFAGDPARPYSLHQYQSFRWQTSEALFTMPYGLHPYQYAYSNPVLHTDPTGKCVPEDIPIFGETGCHWIPDCFITQSNCQSLLASGTANWGDFIRYPWEVFQGIGSPGAWIVDQFAGTNAWNCIWQNPTGGKKIGLTFTGVATGAAIIKYGSEAIRRLLVWLDALGTTEQDSSTVGAQAAPPVAQSQTLIDDVVKNELGNIKFSFHPQYNPSMPLVDELGRPQYGWSLPETSTEIGPQAILEGREQVAITLVHEELHHRVWTLSGRFINPPELEDLVDSAADEIAPIILRSPDGAETVIQNAARQIIQNFPWEDFLP